MLFAIRNGCCLEVQTLVEALPPQIQSFVYSSFPCDYSGWKLDLKGCPFLLFCSLRRFHCICWPSLFGIALRNLRSPLFTVPAGFLFLSWMIVWGFVCISGGYKSGWGKVEVFFLWELRSLSKFVLDDKGDGSLVARLLGAQKKKAQQGSDNSYSSCCV